jgi:hypothetical protein
VQAAPTEEEEKAVEVAHLKIYKDGALEKEKKTGLLHYAYDLLVGSLASTKPNIWQPPGVGLLAWL